MRRLFECQKCQKRFATELAAEMHISDKHASNFPPRNLAVWPQVNCQPSWRDGNVMAPSTQKGGV